MYCRNIYIFDVGCVNLPSNKRQMVSDLVQCHYRCQTDEYVGISSNGQKVFCIHEKKRN